MRIASGKDASTKRGQDIFPRSAQRVSLEKRNTRIPLHKGSWGVDPGEERVIMKAWEDYLAGEAHPPEVRNVVARSWERCAAIGIDPQLPGSKTIIGETEL